MSLIIMNFLKLAAILLAFCVSSLGAEEEFYDLERIKLTSGKVYHGIQILEGDKHGLLFRHKAGIAKIPFEFLSMNLRMLYEPVEDVPGGDEGAVEEEADESRAPAESEEFMAATPTAPVTWVIRTRVSQNYSPCVSGSDRYRVPSLGYLPEYRAPWKPHWGRYPLALSLANPRFRALAVEDFLSVVYPTAYPCAPRAYPVPLRTYYAFH